MEQSVIHTSNDNSFIDLKFYASKPNSYSNRLFCFSSVQVVKAVDILLCFLNEQNVLQAVYFVNPLTKQSHRFAFIDMQILKELFESYKLAKQIKSTL